VGHRSFVHFVREESEESGRDKEQTGRDEEAREKEESMDDLILQDGRSEAPCHPLLLISTRDAIVVCILLFIV
jgi:hypothetical protein